MAFSHTYVCVCVCVIAGRIRCFTPEGIVLDSGEEVPADSVVFCTGYSQKMSFIDPKVRSHIQIDMWHAKGNGCQPTVSRQFRVKKV